jgi:hypothetical protein
MWLIAWGLASAAVFGVEPHLLKVLLKVGAESSRKAMKDWSHPPESNRRPSDYESEQVDSPEITSVNIPVFNTNHLQTSV